MSRHDVTEYVEFGNPDDECLPITLCICGAKYEPWDKIISIYDDDPRPMPCCGRKLFFRQVVTVLEVKS